MKTKKQKYLLFVVLAVLLCLLLCFAILKKGKKPEPAVLNVSLYKLIPDLDSFEKTIEDAWKEKHPETELNFVDWDCYSGSVPDDLDVFVFDVLTLDSFVENGYLLPLSENDIQDYDDLIPSFVEQCRVDGDFYVVPQILCADLLYTRKQDAGLKDVQDLDSLYDVLGDSGLLLDKSSLRSRVCMYLQAVIDENQQFTNQPLPIEEGNLSADAVGSLEEIRDMHQINPEGEPEDGGRYYYARRFAEGMGRAYIGYTEAMAVMGENVSEMDFRLFSMTDEADIPVFYVDAAAVNAKISEEKKAAALDFLNLITSEDTVVRTFMNYGEPQYLLPARYSSYDALATEYPIYADLKKIVSVPNAYAFRIKQDWNQYMETASENEDALPALVK